MEFLTNLSLGFDTAFTLTNLAWCLLGVTLGTIVGVLPGFGPVASISMLLPLTYTLGDPLSSLIMLAGVYYGSQYGGSTTSILLNLPGESASVITTIDGYQMSQNGRGGAALAIAAIGSFFAGTVATLIIALFAVPLSKMAYAFGPTEYAALMVLGLLAAAMLSQGSVIKAVAMVILGLLLSTVGVDINSGVSRFTFKLPELYEGIHFAVLAMGMFGLAEVVYNIRRGNLAKPTTPKLRELYPNKEEMKAAAPAILRGTFIGSVLGLLPGTGAVMSSFAAYAVEKKLSKNPEKFGKGAIEGVAAPESANNAGAQTGFIPMLSLGLPTTPVMALMIGAMMLQDIVPGPQLIGKSPELFWGLIVSMWIGNLLLVVLNLPLVGIWVRLLSISKYILYPFIFLLCILGAYNLNGNWFDVVMLFPFALLGYFFKVYNCEPAPLAMGFVVGGLFEEYLRRSLVLSEGNWLVFFDKPISLTMIVVIVLLFVYTLFKGFKNGHNQN